MGANKQPVVGSGILPPAGEEQPLLASTTDVLASDSTVLASDLTYTP